MKKVHLIRIAVMTIAVTLLVFSSEGYAKKDVGSGLSEEDRYLKKVYVSEALDLMEKGEYKEALIKLIILAEKYPDTALYWSSLAQCHFELKAYEEAIAAADVAIALEPFAEVHYHTRAKAYYELERYKEAIPDFEKFLSKFPTNSSAHLLLGICYLRENLLPEAEKELRRAKDLSGYLAPYADFQLGVIALKRGQTEEGIHHLERTLEAAVSGPTADAIQKQIEGARAAAEAAWAAPRNWYGSITAGYEYSNNILSLSKDALLPSDITSRRDSDLFLVLQGGYRFYRDDRHQIWGTGLIYGNTYSDLNNMDVQQVTPQILYLYTPPTNWRFQSSLYYTHYSVDWDETSDSISMTPALTYAWNDRMSTTVDYSVSLNNFEAETDPSEDRDGYYSAIRGYQSFNFREYKLLIDLGADYRWNNTDGSEFDSDSYGFFVTLSHAFVWDSRLKYDVNFSWTDFDNLTVRADPAFSTNREDDSSVVAITWLKRFTEHWSTSLLYSYLDNDSNITAYDFDKYTISGSLTYSF